MNCLAIGLLLFRRETEEEALATGLTLEELRSRSFLKILQNRRR